MKKDPLSIINTMVLNLNLLEPSQQYNINELKFLKDLNLHWVTIKKYINIISLIQKYAPKIDIKDSKFNIIYSDIYNRLNDKEKCILWLYNRRAIDQDSAVELGQRFEKIIDNSIGYLFERTYDNKFYLNEVGKNIYNSIKQDILSLIYEDKSINEIFFEKRDMIEVFFSQVWINYSLSDTQEGSIIIPREGRNVFDHVKTEEDLIINF
ncbi:hypothetical protein LCGC14_1481980 [marine sediment metagenome]|uniref:Uncharacterized protein n=1 Tax=marine sediment metagenome TaxID=412755 RepID=A0A0F9MB37_9ZZZZ